MALGVGGAVAGWGCATASADESTSVSGGSEASASTDAPAAKGRAGNPGPRSAPKNKVRKSPNHKGGALTDDRDDDDAEQPRGTLRRGKHRQTPMENRQISDVPGRVPDRAVVTLKPRAESEPLAVASATATAKPRISDTVVTALRNPFTADAAPKVPSAQPGVWAVLAAARREVETAMKPALPRQPVESSTTSQIVHGVAAVENSLTYTPGPQLRDQGAVLVQYGLKAISDIIGVNIYQQINTVLESDRPPLFLTLGMDTRQTTFTTAEGAEWQVWEIHPPNPSGKTVIAMHGGGFISEPNLLHWIDYTFMARETGAVVVVPMYPLATTEAGRATVVIPGMADFISHQIQASGGAENVSVYADSAGSTLAMGAVRELILRGDPVPSSMVILSLSADFSMQNPDIAEIDDPILGDWKESTGDAHFTDGITDLRDPLISPLFFEPEVLQGLPPTTIYVGEVEILYPDTLLLHERAVAEGAPISVVVGTGLLHDWPLSGLPIYSQTSVVRPDIYRQLGLTDESATPI
ncbi:alpha/beta hydrolase fold domain-containing protein [Mycolicibacterium sp. XJ870]